MSYRAVAFILLMAGGLRAATLSVEPPSAHILVGNSGSITINASNVADLFAYQFDLAFDPTLLHALGVFEGPFLATGGSTQFIPGSIDNSAGLISGIADSLTGPVAGVTGGGVLVTIFFQALQFGTSPISLSNFTLLDSSLSDIPATAIDGVVSTPEPRSISFLLLGLLGVAGVVREQKTRPKS